MTKMKVCVFLLVEKKKEFNEFDLPDDALITDLKEALAESEGFPCSLGGKNSCIILRTSSRECPLPLATLKMMG